VQAVAAMSSAAWGRDRQALSGKSRWQVVAASTDAVGLNSQRRASAEGINLRMRNGTGRGGGVANHNGERAGRVSSGVGCVTSCWHADS
jgi:hypothetical protein